MQELKNYIEDALKHCEAYDPQCASYINSVKLYFFNVGYKMCLEKIKSIIDDIDARSTDGEV